MTAHGWTFLSNHGHVLVCLAVDPNARLRDIAASVGVTERAVQGIVADLLASGHVERRRVGRRNHYRIRRCARFRHPLESATLVGDFVDLVTRSSGAGVIASPTGSAVTVVQDEGDSP